MARIPIGIVVSSDRAADGIYEDRGGPAVVAYLKRVLTTPFDPHVAVTRDDAAAIATLIRAMADQTRCPLILTTGGTGPAARDVTPEATVAVCDRLLPGFGDAMRLASMKEVPTAILSRQLAGTRGSSLIVNLPGKPSSIATCLDAVFAAIPYCIDLIGGPRLNTDPHVCCAFRPE